MTRIGFLGTFSVDNAGDVLVGYATRQALHALLPDAEQQVFSPYLPHWEHDFSAARGIDREIVAIPMEGPLDWANDLDALVVGGGGIVSLDRSFRSFLLEGWDPERPAAWNGVCSQNQAWYVDGYEETYQLIRRCCDSLRYVSVRNDTTVRFLRHCGYAGAIEKVPDPALLLSVPPDVDPRVEALLVDSGVDPAHLKIGVSVGNAIEDPRAAKFFDDLFGGLARLIESSAVPVDVVLFPYGYIRGDAPLQALAARRLPRAVVVERHLQPLEAWRLVGKMDFYLGARYHAMLAAFAQRVPFLVMDEYLSDHIASSKTREFIVEQGLEPCYLSPWVSLTPSWKLWGLFAAREKVSYTCALARCRRRLADHYHQMVNALGLS